MKDEILQSKGEIWLELNEVYHRVMEWRHLAHDKGDECVVELVLGTAMDEDDEDIVGGDSRYVFRAKGSHGLWEQINRYSAESKGDDVLVISSAKDRGAVSMTVAIMPREQFHELVKWPEFFGKVEALVLLRREEKEYLVKQMEARIDARGQSDADGNIIQMQDTSEITMRCLAPDGEVKEFKMRAQGLMPAYTAVVEQEQRTGSKMLLLIDADTGEWWTYNLNEMKDKLPVVSEILKKFQQKQYIT